ncbi:MAG: sensor histidine kinase, partial [Spirochaetia bacterium]|nr:sensor histidine kinase [Spirochaetia bacterium]
AANNLLTFRLAGPHPGAQGAGGVPGLFYGDGYRIAPSGQVQRDSDETGSIALMSLYLGFGIYHLILFLGRRRERFNLYFGLFSVGVFLYFFSRTGFAYGRIANTAILTTIEHVSLMFLFPFLFLFLQSYFYPKDRVPLWMRGMLALDIVLSAVLTVAPPEHFYYPVEIWRYTHLPVGLLVPPYFLGRAILMRTRDAGKLSAGIILLYVAAGWDMVNSLFHIRSMNPLFEYGFFSFVMSQVVTLARRFAILENDRDTLIQELDEKNASLLQLDKMKDRFLASTSHELRTPLHGIIGLADSLLMGAAGTLPDAARQNLAMIIQSGRRLSTLVDEVLDFSRLQDGNVRLELQSINLPRLTESVLVTLRPLLKSEDVILVNAVPRDTPPVEADESRLQQILINLVGNAIKFTKRGHIKVTARNTGAMVEVSVEDTGIGIPEDKQEAIFEYFEQGHESAGTQYGGAGLG